MGSKNAAIVIHNGELADALDDLQRAKTLLAGERTLLEMAALGRPLNDILDAVCRFVEEISPECIVGIYPIDWSGPVFKYGVAPSLPLSYIDPIKGWPVREDKAPCGIAVAENRQVIVVDVETDPIWRGTEYRDHVVSHGLRSVWSTLIRSVDGRILGSFCIYQAQPASPSPLHQELIARGTHIAAIALDRFEADEALRARTSELSRALSQLSEAQRLSKIGSFTADLQRDEHEWSEEYYRIFDIDPRTRPSVQIVRDRVHADDLALFDREIRLGMNGANADFTFRIVTPSGALKYLRGVASLVKHQDGRPIFVGTIQDITERIRAEQATDHARMELARVARAAALSTLTASIAHEINQPLSGIMTNASTCLRLLADDPPNITRARATAERTIRDANRATEVIKRLRELFAHKARDPEPLDLGDAAREIIALSAAELQRGRAIVHTNLGASLPPVSGDRVQLQQVMLNLVLNAVEAMRETPSGPRDLWVSTAQDSEGHVRLDVRDSGPGVAPENLEQLFGAFYTTKAEGMGVGLSLSRSIIEAHGGRLWAHRNADGPGLTFSFSLPSCTASTADTVRSKRVAVPALKEA